MGGKARCTGKKLTGVSAVKHTMQFNPDPYHSRSPAGPKQGTSLSGLFPVALRNLALISHQLSTAGGTEEFRGWNGISEVRCYTG